MLKVKLMNKIAKVGTDVLSPLRYEVSDEVTVEDAVMVQKSLFRIERLLFCETNPAPIKFALSTKKICENELRLPLAPINEDLCKKIEEEVKKIEQNI